MSKIAIIIGAGPAGLTAAYELLQRSDIIPIVLEVTSDIGGISKTITHNNNRMDMGGHRFFSKSQKIMDWWLNIFPLQGVPSKDDILLNRNLGLSAHKNTPDPSIDDKVMLIRTRYSSILYNGKFYDYPLKLNWKTVKSLGFIRIVIISWSYIIAQIFPIKPENSLEDFMINRFGRVLYKTFFKDYTMKIWGRYPLQIEPAWGIQRIKGLSVTKIILHALHTPFRKDRFITQKRSEISLIEKFIYPKYGPGQLWEEVAEIIKTQGGKVLLNKEVRGFNIKNNLLRSVIVYNSEKNKTETIKGDYFLSSMPVKDLINGLQTEIPEEVKVVANGLIYRNFRTAGVLLKKLKIKNQSKTSTINDIIPELWIYIQEKKVKIGRLQVFNNWSPYMVDDDSKVWLGLEYFLDDKDELWLMEDADFAHFAISELVKIEIIDSTDVLDYKIERIPKAYPAYFGTYDKFEIIRNFIDRFENLFPIGRNGMHRYNNMDHSMLTAMTAVDNIVNNSTSKDNIWNVNIEKEYHEEK